MNGYIGITKRKRTLTGLTATANRRHDRTTDDKHAYGNYFNPINRKEQDQKHPSLPHELITQSSRHSFFVPHHP